MRRAAAAGLLAGALLLALVFHRHAGAPTTAASATVVAGSRRAAGAVRPPPTLPALRPIRPTQLAALGFGDGPDQVGRRRDPESAAEGPMALARGRDGTLWILDQVHGRVLRRGRDGRFGAPITIGGETAQDLRAIGDGITVLDRLGEHTLARYDAVGRLVDDRPLSSFGVAEGGGVTGLFEADGEPLVEESLAGQGRRVVHGAGGVLLPGRPSRDGAQLLTAQIVRAEPGTIVVHGLDRGGGERFSTALSVGRPVLSIALLDSDVAGGIYAGVLHAAAPVPPSHDLTDERLDVFRLAPDGAQVSHVSVPHPPSGLESFRELEIADVGVVWWMHALPDGSGVAVDELAL